jgi:1-deoxy-D-xylulose-5-phosphate synthase
MNCVGRRVVADLAVAGVYPRALALQNIGRGFVTHGSVSQLDKLCGLDAASLCARAEEVCAHD